MLTTRAPRLLSALAVAALGLTGLVATPATAVPAAATTSSAPVTHHLAGDLGPATGDPRAWASRALAAHADRLGLDADAVRWERVRHTAVGTTVRGRAYRGDVPVLGTDVLAVARDGRVVQLDGVGTSLAGAPSSSIVGRASAVTTALTRLDVTSLLVPASVTRVLAPSGGRLVDTLQVSVVGKAPAVAARVDLDAATGQVLRVVDDADHADGVSVPAKIFDPNPLVTARDTSIRSPFETMTGVDVPLPSAELTQQLRTVKMRRLDPTLLQLGVLSGPWADIVAPVGYLNPLGGTLTYSRTDPRFVGLMAYAHVDRYQAWLQKLGIKGANDEAQRIVPTLAQGYDNSFYQPGNDLIVFGGGGVPDAEDAEVILHEYGHAMQDAQVPGYGATDEGGAMGEGFGDFNAANYYALTSGGFNDLCVAEWDATAYSTDDPPCLRRMDSTKTYPKDIEGEVHADGELWSAYLWRLRSHLGTTTQQRSVNAIRLVLAMHELLTPQAEFADAVAGLRTAAKALKHPGWEKFVVSEAKKTGFPVKR